MTDLDRPGLIELLDRLGADNDQAVLDAARELHRRVNASGLSWTDLISLESDAAERPEEPPEEATADDRQAEQAGGMSAAERAEAARIIDRLLARKTLSSTLREDLAEMKRTIADGSFDAMDSRYLRALARRLGA